MLHVEEFQTTEGWLAAGPITIGVTAGASTPDQVIAEVLEKTFSVAASNK